MCSKKFKIIKKVDNVVYARPGLCPIKKVDNDGTCKINCNYKSHIYIIIPKKCRPKD